MAAFCAFDALGFTFRNLGPLRKVQSSTERRTRGRDRVRDHWITDVEATLRRRHTRDCDRDHDGCVVIEA